MNDTFTVKDALSMYLMSDKTVQSVARVYDTVRNEHVQHRVLKSTLDRMLLQAKPRETRRASRSSDVDVTTRDKLMKREFFVKKRKKRKVESASIAVLKKKRQRAKKTTNMTSTLLTTATLCMATSSVRSQVTTVPPDLQNPTVMASTTNEEIRSAKSHVGEISTSMPAPHQSDGGVIDPFTGATPVIIATPVVVRHRHRSKNKQRSVFLRDLMRARREFEAHALRTYDEHCCNHDDNDDDAESDKQCAICTNNIRLPATLNCTHTFCTPCIQLWLTMSKSKACPLCKADVRCMRDKAGQPIPIPTRPTPTRTEDDEHGIKRKINATPSQTRTQTKIANSRSRQSFDISPTKIVRRLEKICPEKLLASPVVVRHTNAKVRSRVIEVRNQMSEQSSHALKLEVRKKTFLKAQHTKKIKKV